MDVLSSLQYKDDDEEEVSEGDHQPSEYENESDYEHRYNKLFDAVISLDGKKRRTAPQRSEPRTEISEFAVKDAGHDKVKLHELALSLGKNAAHTTLKKQIRQAQRYKKVLPVPLPKTQADKINRTLNYEKTKEEVSKWESVVEHNRTAAQISFPLRQTDIRLKTGPELAKQFKPMTPLEEEVMALLQGSKHVLKDDRLLTPAEEEAFKSMSLEEALEKRQALQKMRALQSHMEAKARRQNRIKSKRYRRLLKKEKLKTYVKEFEELREKNPEAALLKLDEINKQRILERMTLRHRGTGKWAKQTALRAKYDKESRQAFAEQMQINRELTQKKALASDQSEDEEETALESGAKKASVDPFNPWVNVQDKDSKPEEPAKSYRKEWAKSRQEISKLKQKKAKKMSTKKVKFNTEEKSEREAKTRLKMEVQKKLKEKQKQKKGILKNNKKKKNNSKKNSSKTTESSVDILLIESRHSEVDAPIITEINGDDVCDDVATQSRADLRNNKIDANIAEKDKSDDEEEKVEIDPKKFVDVPARRLKSALPNIVEAGDDNDDDDDEVRHRMTISEAFADDDVISSFKEEKKAIVDRNKPKDIDTYLPGWGSWAGKGIRDNPRRRKRFRIKAPPAPPRKDRGIGNVIIYEGKDEAISKFQVSELPFPFTNITTFESSIRAPIGKMWNSEIAHRNLTEPKIITKKGSVIEPIDSDALVNKRKPDRRKLAKDEG